MTEMKHIEWWWFFPELLLPIIQLQYLRIWLSLHNEEESWVLSDNFRFFYLMWTICYWLCLFPEFMVSLKNLKYLPPYLIGSLSQEKKRVWYPMTSDCAFPQKRMWQQNLIKYLRIWLALSPGRRRGLGIRCILRLIV